MPCIAVVEDDVWFCERLIVLRSLVRLLLGGRLERSADRNRVVHYYAKYDVITLQTAADPIFGRLQSWFCPGRSLTVRSVVS